MNSILTFSQLRPAIGTLAYDLVISTDRQKGLIAALQEALPITYTAFCLAKIADNIGKKFRYHKKVHQNLWTAASTFDTITFVALASNLALPQNRFSYRYL